MTTLTIETEDPQIIKAVKALLKGFEVNYKEDSDSPYDPEFVEMIKEGERELKEGKGIKMTAAELAELWK